METEKPRESQQTSTKLGPPQGASKYQLFLPDSEMASKIGRENMFPEDTVDAHSTEDSLAVVNPGALVAEAILERGHQAKPDAKLAPEVRLSRRGSQRVSFGPAATEDEDEMKKRTKTIYYGRDRSKSRTRLKDVPKDQQAVGKQQQGATAASSARQRRDKSTNRYNEAEVMMNL